MKLTLTELRNNLATGMRLSDMPLRVTAYVRVSTEHEEQKNSLINQEKYFIDKIQDNPAWTYVGLYKDEAKSGTTVEHRDEFLHMMNDAKSGLFDLILTKEVSRFARDLLDSIWYTRELQKYHVGVYFEDMALNTLEPDSELRLAIMASIAQEESRKLSERVKFGWKRGTERGVRRGATPPLGYLFNNDNNGFSIDKQTEQVVKTVFAVYSEGNTGFRTIAQDLAKKGYVNSAGNPYNPSTFKRMIRNPVYLGNIVNGKSIKESYRSKKKTLLPSAEWVLCHDEERVPPLIDIYTWEKANAVLDKRGEKMRDVDCSSTSEDGSAGGRYTYSRRIVCEEHNMHYHRASSRWQVDGEQFTAEYWRCNMYKKYGRKQCSSPLLYTRDLNNIMRDIFTGFIPKLQENTDSLASIIKSAICPQNSEEEISRLEGMSKQVRNKRAKLLDGWVDGIISTEIYKAKDAQLDEQLKKANDRISDIKHVNESVALAERVNTMISCAAENCLLESDIAVEELVRSFVKEIRVKNIDNICTLEIWMYGGDEPIVRQCNQTAHYPARRIAP